MAHAKNDKLGTETDGRFTTFYASGNGGANPVPDGRGGYLARGYYWYAVTPACLNGPFTTRRRARDHALTCLESDADTGDAPAQDSARDAGDAHDSGDDGRTIRGRDGRESRMTVAQAETVESLKTAMADVWGPAGMILDSVTVTASARTPTVYVTVTAAPESLRDAATFLRYPREEYRHIAVGPRGAARLIGYRSGLDSHSCIGRDAYAGIHECVRPRHAQRAHAHA